MVSKDCPHSMLERSWMDRIKHGRKATMTVRTRARLPVVTGIPSYVATARFGPRRVALGLSQSEVARRAGVAPSLVCRFENGQAVRSVNAGRIVGALGLTLEGSVRSRLLRRNRP